VIANKEVKVLLESVAVIQ